MNFSQVVGSKESIASLRSLVVENIMPHALLISGPGGNAKLALALSYASYIMCEDKQQGDSCGVCRSCVKTGKHIHPDVHFSFPFTGSNAIADEFIKPWRRFIDEKPYGQISDWLQYLDASNKQANINVKECRSIIRKLNMQSFESDHKILIIWLPEFLRKEGNRLLKIIEEPTDNTYFILITEKTNDILPTIISRCQHIKIPPLQDKEVQEALENKLQLDPSKAKSIAFIAEGDMNKAYDLANKGSKTLETDVLDWFRICYSGKAEVFVEWVDTFAKIAKDEQKSFLQYALNFLREVARVDILEENQLRLQEKEIQTAKKIAGIINFEKIDKLNKILTDTIYYIERNANIKVLMMDTNISFKNVLRQK